MDMSQAGAQYVLGIEIIDAAVEGGGRVVDLVHEKVPGLEAGTPEAAHAAERLIYATAYAAAEMLRGLEKRLGHPPARVLLATRNAFQRGTELMTIDQMLDEVADGSGQGAAPPPE